MMIPRAALVVSFLTITAGAHVSAQEAGSSINAPPPPGMHNFELRRDTLEERDAFLKRRQAQQGREKASEVPPLPAQRITPVAPQRQK